MALYMQLYKALNYLVEHGAAVGESVKNAAYPLYLMGKAATGDLLSFVWFALTVALLFAVIYALLSVSFIRIATARRGAAKVEYRRHAMRKNSVFKALFLKEVRRFTGSAMYMLNSGLGSIILPIGCVAAIIKRNDMLAYADMIPGFRENLPLIALVAICSIAAMNMVTAPSVSLEGRNLWLLKSLPVRGADILNAKLLLHMLVTAPIAAVSGMVFAVLLKPGAVLSLILVVTPVIMTLVCGELGLIFNLLMPKLDWTNETYAVKQSMSVLVTMLTGWGILMVFGLLYPVLSIPGDWYCTGCTLLLILAAGMLYRVLVGWGSRKLMAL